MAKNKYSINLSFVLQKFITSIKAINGLQTYVFITTKLLYLRQNDDCQQPEGIENQQVIFVIMLMKIPETNAYFRWWSLQARC